MTKTKATAARSFNADALRAEREEAPVTIGGRPFRAVKQTTTLRAALRTLQEEQAKIGVEARALAKDDDIDPVEKVAREADLDTRAETIMYRMVSVQLADDAGEHPDVGWLADELAPQEVGPLVEFLNGVEAAPDPS